MENLLKFIIEHSTDDISRLALDRKKYPDIDIDLAINSIESRRKLRGKVQEWFDEPGLIFPLKLSAEQCSSSATGRYKAELAEKIAGRTGWTLADLTGGLGVDSWFFSQKASMVIYNEMQTALCQAARHNFKVLGAENITILNNEITPGRCLDSLRSLDLTKGRSLDLTAKTDCHSLRMSFSDFVDNERSDSADEKSIDIVYIDPARRGEGGKKVFLIEDCTPDVLTLKDEIFKITRHLLIKLSPMADITMVCDRLGERCREVHVVATGGECKELMIWMDREWSGEYTIIAAELHPDSPTATFAFTPSAEKNAQTAAHPSSESIHDEKSVAEGWKWMEKTCHPRLGGVRPEGERGSSESIPSFSGLYLFEPGKSLMKSGAFNLISSRFEIAKIGKSTHYYLTDSTDKALTLKTYGKVFEIMEILPLDKRSIKEIGKKYPKAEVTARNIPMDTDTLRKKTGITSGDDAHIFGLKSDSEGNLLIAAKRI